MCIFTDFNYISMDLRIIQTRQLDSPQSLFLWYISQFRYQFIFFFFFNKLSIFNESLRPNKITKFYMGVYQSNKKISTSHTTHMIAISILEFYLLYKLKFQYGRKVLALGLHSHTDLFPVLWS